MKKVLFGVLCISLVTVMSCGGGGGAADANSTVAGAAVSACLANAGSPYTASMNEVGVNTSTDVPVDSTINCSSIPGGVSGTMKVSGTISVVASDTSATIDGTLTEVMTACTIKDTACSFGNVVGDGTLTVTINGGSNGSAVTFTETVKGDLSFVFKSKTLACPVDLALNVTADTTYTQEGLEDGMTGTICGADWTAVKAALKDSAKMTELCTAFDKAATTEL